MVQNCKDSKLLSCFYYNGLTLLGGLGKNWLIISSLLIVNFSIPTERNFCESFFVLMKLQ